MSSVRKSITAAFAAALIAIGSAPSLAAPIVPTGLSIERSSDLVSVSSSTSRKRLKKAPSRNGGGYNRPARGAQSLGGPSSRSRSQHSESHRRHGDRQSYNRPTPNRFSNNRPPRYADGPSSSRPSHDRHNKRLRWYDDGPSLHRFSENRRPDIGERLRDHRSRDRWAPNRLPWNAYGPSHYNPSPRSPSLRAPSYRGPSWQGDRPWDKKRWYRGGRPWDQNISGDRYSKNWRDRNDRPGRWNGHNGSGDERPGWKQNGDGWWYPPVAFGLDAVIDGTSIGQSAYSDAHLQWCTARYRTYNAIDNTFQPNDGPRRECVSPY